jgi:pimeloyl-ACP methyl ester carboxylesterase
MELGKSLPSARIMTFGYDADVIKLWGMVGGNNLRNHGKSLATDVSDRRRKDTERPLVFIAHSLGGLVCEQALLICREGEPSLEKVFKSTKGIIFMGTPLGGADLANLGYKLAKCINTVRKTNFQIVGNIQRNSEILLAVQQQFRQLLQNSGTGISVYCFFEEKAVGAVGFIVPEASAVLPQYPNQSIAGNHMDMVRFSGSRDGGYQKVLNRMEDIVERIDAERATSERQRSEDTLLRT